MQLKERDQSENPTFATNLSQVWESLMQHTELAQTGQLKSSIHLEKLEKLLNKSVFIPFMEIIFSATTLKSMQEKIGSHFRLWNFYENCIKIFTIVLSSQNYKNGFEKSRNFYPLTTIPKSSRFNAMLFLCSRIKSHKQISFLSYPLL